MNVSKGFLLVLVVLSTLVTVVLVWPFLQYVLIAILLAYVLYPLQKRLEPRIGSASSSIALVVAATVAFLLPFVVTIGLIAGDVANAARNLGSGDLPVGTVESTVREWTGREIDLVDEASDYAASAGESLLGGAPDFVGAMIHTTVGVGLAAFLLFFLLKDGDSLIRWIRRIVPLPDDVQDDLFAELHSITWAVLVGHVAVAIIQGVLAGLGLLVTGVPSVIFWTFLMVLLSLIPLVGSFLVWGPAAVWLALNGSTVAAVGLVIWGTIVVGLSDDFLRPLIVGRAEVNPSVIIIGVLGGMYVMGFIGLFFGPILVGACKVLLETFDEHYWNLERRPERADRVD